MGTSLGAWSRASKIIVVYVFLLPLSLGGAYFASQLDAPYGWRAGVESMSQAAAGWLMLLPGVILAAGIRRRSAVTLGVIGLLAGLLLAWSMYDTYRELYAPYASSLAGRPEYVALAPLMFVLDAGMGIAAIPALLVMIFEKSLSALFFIGLVSILA